MGGGGGGEGCAGVDLARLAGVQSQSPCSSAASGERAMCALVGPAWSAAGGFDMPGIPPGAFTRLASHMPMPSVSTPTPIQFCYTGGYIEAGLQFPGDDYISGFCEWVAEGMGSVVWLACWRMAAHVLAAQQAALMLHCRWRSCVFVAILIASLPCS